VEEFVRDSSSHVEGVGRTLRRLNNSVLSLSPQKPKCCLITDGALQKVHQEDRIVAKVPF